MSFSVDLSSTTSETGEKLTTSASSAVNSQLKTLCLHEFPCGLGSWREPKSNTNLARWGRNKIKPVTVLRSNDSKDSSVLVQMEKSEALQDMVSSHFSPWHLDYSWSKEAKELREVAVKSPWLIDRDFVLNYFKTLRIVDKNVAEVDNNLLMLKNLEELTLSANFIRTVNSRNLPQSLKVLELCANQISDISSLCVRPPLLEHLGLGYNKIMFIGDYITGDYWPNLLSLDLSHNDLCDLMDIVRKLVTLPNLRNLLLQGCPLCLIPSYRGYTIDSLRHLGIMDDVHISADEKHHFKGLARRREFIVDEAKVQLGVTYIKGLPCPDEIKFPESQPEFPFVERRYFVQFMFPEERIVDIQDDTENSEQTELELEIEAAAIGNEHHENSPEHPERPMVTSQYEESPPTTERRVEINTQPEVKNLTTATQNSPNTFPRSNPVIEHPGRPEEEIRLDLTDGGLTFETEAESTRRPQKEEAKAEDLLKLAPINSEPQPWSEEIELNWTTDVTRDDLLTLRDFFKVGMDFNVVESVVLGYPATDQNEIVSERSEKEAKEKDKKKTPPAKGKGSAKKRGKKEPDIDLIRSPATYTTIASFHVTLDNFLDGEFEYQNIFTKGDVPPPSTIRSIEPEKSKNDSPADEDIKGATTDTSFSSDKKDNKDKKKPDKAGEKKKEKDKNENAKKPTTHRGSKGGIGKVKHEEGEEDDGSPPPLELEVTVKLHHWTTAMDSVREEEERTKALLAARTKEINENPNSQQQLSTGRRSSKDLLHVRKGSQIR